MPRPTTLHLAAALLFVAGLGAAWLEERRERGCLALAIYHEARGESERGQLAVGHVVRNRMEDPAFPATACDVVFDGGETRDRCQFSFYCDGRSDEVTEAEAMEHAEVVASRVLVGAGEDPTRGALWYHARTVQPDWSQVHEPSATLGRHVFYRRAREASRATQSRAIFR